MKPAQLLSARTMAGAAIAAGSAGAILAVAGVSSPARAPLVLIYLAVAPAAAVAPLLAGFDRLARLIVSAATALVVNLLVAEVMLAAGRWSPRASVVVVTLLGVACAACAAARRARMRAPVRRALALVRGAAVRPATGDRADTETVSIE